MNIKEFTIISNYDGLPLKGVVYEPNGTPKGIVHLVHGMVEYKGRYKHVLQFFAENGYVTACHDHRGHGESVEKEEDFGWFHDFKAKAIVDDCVQVTEYLQKEYPNLKTTLFGHSMGSMVVRCYIQEKDELLDRLIVCGSPSNNPLSGTAIALTKIVRFFRGERHRSPLFAYLATGKGNEDFAKAGKGSWLTRDDEFVKAYNDDPKCKFRFTVNGFENLFRLMKNTYTKKRYKVKNPNLPILFIAGSDDAVIGSKEQWEKSVDFLRKVGYKDVKGKLYEGMRHEVHNEIGKEEVLSDLLEFIERET
ncbi:MAG: lysophospholipase [Clostridia bacterium]|nr:lysophospholipase [Clostridia bacterium]